MSRNLKIRNVILLVILAQLLAACVPEQEVRVKRGKYYIDERFMPCIIKIEANETLSVGNALSPAWLSPNGKIYQYYENATFEYDPQSPFPQCRLVTAGPQWSGISPSVPAPSDPAVWYENGHIIWPEAAVVVKALGLDVVGRPLGEVFTNPVTGDFEQYYENLGFGRKRGDPSGQVYLLPYGKWLCGDWCQQPTETMFIPLQSGSILPFPEVENYFNQTAERLGWGLTEHALTPVLLEKTPTGEMLFVKLYSNVVMVADPANPSHPYLLAVAEDLGFHRGRPAPQVQERLDVFFSYQDGLGYYVKQAYVDFITKHGNFETLGFPIESEIQIGIDQYRQCFEKICLLDDRTAPEGLRIRPLSLGYLYQIIYKKNQDTMRPTDTPSVSTVQMQIWEQYPILYWGQQQTISVKVLNNNYPVSNVGLVLHVILANGTTQQYEMPATNTAGLSAVTLPTNLKVESMGATVPYKICLQDDLENSYCVPDSFNVWYQQP